MLVHLSPVSESVLSKQSGSTELRIVVRSEVNEQSKEPRKLKILKKLDVFEGITL